MSSFIKFQDFFKVSVRLFDFFLIQILWLYSSYLAYRVVNSKNLVFEVLSPLIWLCCQNCLIQKNNIDFALINVVCIFFKDVIWRQIYGIEYNFIYSVPLSIFYINFDEKKLFFTSTCTSNDVLWKTDPIQFFGDSTDPIQFLGTLPIRSLFFGESTDPIQIFFRMCPPLICTSLIDESSMMPDKICWKNISYLLTVF